MIEKFKKKKIKYVYFQRYFKKFIIFYKNDKIAISNLVDTIKKKSRAVR